jgi:hypothetical protein
MHKQFFKAKCTVTLTDPDLTVPIAAGLSSAVIVLAVIAVVVVYLKRRQRA